MSEKETYEAPALSEIGEVTLDDILQIYGAHGEGHIDQIDRTLAAQHR